MIKIEVRKLDELKQKLDEIPRGARGEATEAAAMALIGNERQGLQYYPPRVLHGEGNPYQWQSERQRRAFFATNGFGRGIPSERTYALRFGWKAQDWGDRTKIKVINDAPEARFVMGDDQQRGHTADGWRHYQQVIADNINLMFLRADQAVARWLKSRGW